MTNGCMENQNHFFSSINSSYCKNAPLNDVEDPTLYEKTDSNSWKMIFGRLKKNNYFFPTPNHGIVKRISYTLLMSWCYSQT